MASLTETDRHDFWDMCEERCQMRSLILASQMPVARWHEQIGDPALADGTLDSLVFTFGPEWCSACVRNGVMP